MDITGYVLDIVACPECRFGLSYNSKKASFKCSRCRRVFPVKEGVPFLSAERVGDKVKESVHAAYEEFKEEPMDDYYSSPVAGYFSRLRVKSLLREAGDLRGRLVLDVGCEAGYVSSRFLRRGARVVGFDICVPALHIFRKRLGVTPIMAFSQKMPFRDSSFDIVVCTEVIEHMPMLDECIKEMHRVLKPGGRLLLTFPNEGLRKKFYPLIKLFSGINTDVEEHVTLFDYNRDEVYAKFANFLKLKKRYPIHWLLPITNVGVFVKLP